MHTFKCTDQEALAVDHDAAAGPSGSGLSQPAAYLAAGVTESNTDAEGGLNLGVGAAAAQAVPVQRLDQAILQELRDTVSLDDCSSMSFGLT